MYLIFENHIIIFFCYIPTGVIINITVFIIVYPIVGDFSVVYPGVFLKIEMICFKTFIDNTNNDIVTKITNATCGNIPSQFGI